MQLTEAYIVSSVRTPVGKAKKGVLRDVRPEHLATVAVQGAIARVPGLTGERVEDLVLGCAFPEGPQGMNVARAIAQKAGLPDSVPGVTVNRFCSSGLQTIAQAVNAVTLGQAECIVAGGVESMSAVPMGGFFFAPDPTLATDDPDFYASMGITAENVAAQYGVSREDQDAFAARSHHNAAAAIAGGPLRRRARARPGHGDALRRPRRGRPSRRRSSTRRTRARGRDTTVEALAKLRPAFKVGGTVTGGQREPDERRRRGRRS